MLEAYGWVDLKTWHDRPGHDQTDHDRSGRATLPLADRLARGDEDLEQEILQRLVDLNHERAAEEARGLIRYLRPEFQDPDYGKKVAHKQQEKLDLEETSPSGHLIEASLPEKLPWPKPTVERVATLKTLLATLPPDPAQLSPALKGNKTAKCREEIQDLLETLESLGKL